MDKYCVCGMKVTATTGGYNCPRCLRQYSVKGKQININMYQDAHGRMVLCDIKTMHYNAQEEDEK